MAHPRRFRFGIQLSSPLPGLDWAASARRAEELGYDALFLPDHFGDQLAPVPAMMAAADATERLKVGALVFDNDYKHPVVLAKELATIDVLSGGRVEIGMGAGWMNTDYEQSGIVKDSASVRIDRMVEGIEVMKGLFADGPFDYHGTHYTITGLDGLPKPLQRPHPRFLVGGGGRKVLTAAARHADIVGINATIASGEVDAHTARTAAPDQFDHKVAIVREAAGDRFADIELNVLVFVAQVTDDAAALYEMMAPFFGIEPGEMADAPMVVVGPIDRLVDTLEARRERWDLSYWVFQGDAMEAMAPLVARLSGT